MAFLGEMKLSAAQMALNAGGVAGRLVRVGDSFPME